MPSIEPAAGYILMRTTGAASEPAVVSVSKRFPLASWWRPRRSPVAADAAGRRFAPGLWPTALTLLGVARADRARHLAARPAGVEARADRGARGPAWRRRPSPCRPLRDDWPDRGISARSAVDGEFRHDLEQLFGVAAIDGRVGHHVLTPLVRPGGAAVLVDRGWVPADRAHPAARREGQSAGPVRVSRDRPLPRRATGPAGSPPTTSPGRASGTGTTSARSKRALGLELLPVVIEADATPNPGGLPHRRPDPARAAEQSSAIRDHLVRPRRRPARRLDRFRVDAGPASDEGAAPDGRLAQGRPR